MHSHTRQIHLNYFSHLLNPDLIKLPLPEPEPFTQMVPTISDRKGSPIMKFEKQTGWLLQVPGLTEPLIFARKEKAMAARSYLARHLKAATYLSEFDGDLYDWRTDTVEPKLVRSAYATFHPAIRCGAELRSTLRTIPTNPFRTSMFFTTDAGMTLCPSCVREELVSVISAIRTGDAESDWLVVSCDTHWEDDDAGELTCDHCSRIIEAVYAGVCEGDAEVRSECG